jgi:tryptophan synthase alpha chain
MNRLDALFKNKKGSILSVYFTAGYPQLNDTGTIIKCLADYGADIIEIGMPFSDPLADGPVIQKSNDQALKNGMTLRLLFNQLKNIRKETDIPLLLMGYLNPVIQYGIEEFCIKSAEVGIDGLILPDLPIVVYQEEYKNVVEKHNLSVVFLVAPETSDERVREIDNISRGFVYLVSSSSTTGMKEGVENKQLEYFKRIRNLGLKNPLLIGFGISNNSTFKRVCEYGNGAIIGSAFIKALSDEHDLKENIRTFIGSIRNNK